MTWWEWTLVIAGSWWALVELGRIGAALEGIREILAQMEAHQRKWQLDQEQQG